MFALTVLAVVLIAFGLSVVFVGRAARHIEEHPPRPVYSMDEAYEWVYEGLDPQVAGSLTPREARRILKYGAEYLDAIVGNGAVLDPDDVADYVLERARAAGLELSAEQVASVIAVQMAYLAEIGAVSATR